MTVPNVRSEATPALTEHRPHRTWMGVGTFTVRPASRCRVRGLLVRAGMSHSDPGIEVLVIEGRIGWAPEGLQGETVAQS